MAKEKFERTKPHVNIGTTTQNIILTKRVPRNSIFRPKAGQIPPTMQPSTIPVSMQTINQLFGSFPLLPSRQI